jgi:hypothetical protein
MTARAPLYWNGSQLQEMSSTIIDSFVDLAVYYYSLNPSRTLTVSGSGGNLTAIDDTRLQAGAYSTNTGGYPSEATTAEPGTVTVSYQRITQSAASVTTTVDSGKTFLVYWDGSAIKHMTEADFLDTFVYPAITQMASGSTTSDQAGTYFIATSTSVAGATLVSSTPIFTDTIADTSAYSAATIGDHALDNPTTVTNYYLHIIDGALTAPTVLPLYADGSNNLKSYSIAEIGALLQEFVRYHVVSSSTGYTLTYNIDGSGTARGSSIANTILTGGSGNYQTRFVNADDYRAQEFPDGTAATATTYTFKIYKS